MNITTILWALGGTQFVFLMTALGASLVFFLRSSEPRFQNLLPGFAGGVMTAASVWSLLLPAIEQTAGEGMLPPWLPAAAGLLLGALFITAADAVQKAAAYLNALGYGQMVSTYFSAADGICTVNFAYRAGDYICYPDLIKVSVSLSDGGIVAMDAADYLMNHTDRSFPEPAITAEEAAAVAAENLYVLRTRPAVIPTEAGTENFAYELLCEDEAGQQALVYVDVATGEEDDILILLYADGGTLTK